MENGARTRRGFLAQAAASAALASVPLQSLVASPLLAASEARQAAWTSVALAGAEGGVLTLGQIPAAAVLVHIWASWCAPCVGELPLLGEMAGRMNPAEVATLLVSHPRHWDADQAFLRRTRVRLPAYTLAADTPYELRAAAFGIAGGGFAVPQTLVFAGRDRRCVLARDGVENWRSPELAARLAGWGRSARGDSASSGTGPS